MTAAEIDREVAVGYIRFSVATLDSLAGVASSSTEWKERVRRLLASALTYDPDLERRLDVLVGEGTRLASLRTAYSLIDVENLDLSEKREREATRLIPTELWSDLKLGATALIDGWADMGDPGETGFTDAHVHSGGATSTLDTIDLVLSGLRAKLTRAGWVVPSFPTEDARGSVFDLGRLMVVLHYLTARAVVPAKERDTAAAAAPRDGEMTVWSLFQRYVTDPSDAHGDHQRIREALMTLPNEAGSPGVRAALLSALADPSAPSAHLVDGIVTCVGLATHALRAHLRTSLDAFAQCFGLQSGLRWSFTNAGLSRAEIIDVESERVSRALRAISGAHGLDRVEMRKSFHPNTTYDSDVRVEIVDAFRAHMRGASQFARDRRDQIAFQMPVGLLRDGQHDVGVHPSSDEWAFRYPLPRFLRVVQVVSDVLQSDPELHKYIGSIDVAGRETTTPNWVFALVFSSYAGVSAMRNAPVLDLVVHAGEHFDRPLQGLRHIDEVLEMEPRPKRIGHALALDERRVAGRTPQPVQSAHGVLEDLVWAVRRLEGDYVHRHLRRSLIAQAEQLSPTVFGVDASIGDLVDWSVGRTDRLHIAALGVDLLDVGAFDLEVVWRTASSRRLTTTSLADAMILADLFVADVAYHDQRTSRQGRVSRSDESLELPEATQLAQKAYDALRPIIGRRIRDADVVIECCPSSNVAIGGYSTYADLPIGRWMNEGLVCTVNTDDPGVFGVTVHDELTRLVRSSTLSGSQLSSVLSVGTASTAIGAMSAGADTYERVSYALTT
ncbi:hypothetical protein [Microbacterium sp. PRC9]|uniref:hypothetical protein n=1 Tax=Microbacterium sp. PRC9 TaxID=2962591 RepID=UPI0028828DB0|nr:hypothetical protein [Microbacterium sp. PRC9]MDT0141963.1 hypothetical protein [Microbacterium sp. PRC9]